MWISQQVPADTLGNGNSCARNASRSSAWCSNAGSDRRSRIGVEPACHGAGVHPSLEQDFVRIDVGNPRDPSLINQDGLHRLPAIAKRSRESLLVECWIKRIGPKVVLGYGRVSAVGHADMTDAARIEIIQSVAFAELEQQTRRWRFGFATGYMQRRAIPVASSRMPGSFTTNRSTTRCSAC